jgi:hypothetical protein
MPEIPNTENGNIACLAIAWEIVKESFITNRGDLAIKSGEEGLKELTNAVVKTYSAIVNNSLIK